MFSSLFTDPLFSLQSPSSARDKKQIRRGFIDRQCKGSRFVLTLALARSTMFSKRTTRKIKQRLCTGYFLSNVLVAVASLEHQVPIHMGRNFTGIASRLSLIW